MRSTSPSELPRRARLLVSGQFWLLQVLLLWFLCAEYSDSANPVTWRSWFFLHGGRFSCAASLSLLPGLLDLGGAALVSARRVLACLSASLSSLALFLVYVDTRIYEIFRHHFNGLVWNVLTTPGADETVHLSAREVTTVSLALAALVPLQCGAFLLLWQRASRHARLALPRRGRPGPPWPGSSCWSPTCSSWRGSTPGPTWSAIRT